MPDPTHPNPVPPPPRGGKDDSFTHDFEEASTHRRSHGPRWTAHLAVMLVGALLAGIAYAAMYDRRIRPEDAAIGQDSWTAVTFFQGARLNGWKMKEWADAYPADAGSGPPVIGLWLGNSQMHTVNQRQPDEFVASLYASEALGWPVRTLSLPNASLQDHLAMFHWALAQRKPDWLVVALCYDDLREDGMRPEYAEVTDNAWIDALASAGPAGQKVAGELRTLGETKSGDLQGTTRSSRSTQQVVEDWIQGHLNGFPAWANRPDVLARWELDVRNMRNAAFNVTSATKRPEIPWRTDQNMRAFDELLRVAEANGVRVLAYIVPLRWDPEPPYFLDKYEAWKREIQTRCDAAGALYLDLDRIVPAEFWGSFQEVEIDFMHFQGQGHRLLGAAIGRAIGDAPAPKGASGS